MCKNFFMMLVIGLIASSAMAAGVYDDNTTYDSFYAGPWTNNFNAWRDDNVDPWFGANMGHVLKNSTKSAIDWVGIYVGSSGDYNHLEYTFTAAEAITAQDFGVKLTVQRTNNTSRNRDMDMYVSVNGGTMTKVFDMGDETGDQFGAGAITDDPTLASGYGIDGPERFYTADLSAMNIQAGDTVVYRYKMQQNSPNGSNSKNIGLGVALVPEPATMSLLGFGALALIRRKK